MSYSPGRLYLVVTAGLVTKWSRIPSDRISQHFVNPPSSRFFQPRHHMRIRIYGEGDGGEVAPEICTGV